MGLPYLYSQPQTPDDWKKWAFNHAANHYDMIFAVQTQKNQNLEQFILNPLDPNEIGLWLDQHQSMHNQVNAVLGTQGYDLLSLDPNDPDAFAEWLRQNGDEHVRISALLGLG